MRDTYQEKGFYRQILEIFKDLVSRFSDLLTFIDCYKLTDELINENMYTFGNIRSARPELMIIGHV